jgi:phosphate transport system substrate-binding protein
VFTIGSKSFTVNGATKTLDVPAKIVDGRTVVPIRAISEAIGAEVKYDAAKHSAIVNYFNKMSGTVKVTGSTTVLPIGQAAADKVNGMNTGLAVSVAGGGSGAGIKDAIAGTSNIGMSSREITDDEKATVEVFEVAKDGIAIIVHPDNTVKSLTTEQAKKIFLGEIKNWKDVGGEDAPIFVQTRESGSGTRATLEEMLLSKESVVATATPHASSALIKQGVAKNKNAIGFDSIGYVDSTVKAVSLDGITVNSKTVLDGTYPLSRSLYVVTKGTPSGATAMFIDYLRSAACQLDIVAKEGYIAIK